jgi:hypothetical protein
MRTSRINSLLFLLCSIPTFAQTHRFQVSAIAALQSGLTAPTVTIWYVRKDGGTRYSSIQLQGQCDGQADAAYPGTGTNRHCAFNDARWLWQDGSYSTAGNFPSWGWVIAGGDTVIIRGSIATGVSWRVGWNNSNGALDNGLNYGLQGDTYNSGIPVPPSGTASQHTKILGENYAACTGKSSRTQIVGGGSMYQVLDLSGASYVDIACLDITDFSDGVTSADYARSGIKLTNKSTNDTLTDIRVHGLQYNGLYGPTGTGFVMTDIAIVGNGSSGWNADLGDGTTGVGSLLVQNYDISWNGCHEEYPIVHTLPYTSCRDAGTGGYGDAVGTASVDSPSPGWQITFTNGIVSYNTQDGLDALHVAGAGSTMTVTRSLLFGNQGQQVKAGGGAVATIQNNMIVGNCEALWQTIPGRPVFAAGSGFLDSLGEPCRAGNAAVVLNVIPGHPAAFQGNTIFSAGALGLEVEYSSSSNGAGSPVDTGATNTLLYNDNIFVGFYNAGALANATPIYSTSDLKMLTNPGASWTNNATFGGRSNWPCPAAGETKAVCSDPGLVDETYHAYGYGNMAPASAKSAVVGAGMAITNITTDLVGLVKGVPPSIGAYEPSAAVVTPPPPPVVVPVIPTVTWSNPASIVSGAALSSTQLNAKASVPGSFTYSPAAGTIPAVGTDPLSVTFTPTDTASYTKATATVQIVVTQPAPPPPPPAPKAFTFTITHSETITCTPTLSGNAYKWTCK